MHPDTYEPPRWRVQEDHITFNWNHDGEAFDPTNERHIELVCKHAMTLEHAEADEDNSNEDLSIAWLVDHMGVSREAVTRYMEQQKGE